jgi:NifU-like protein involved in Fe-S cluster formation
MPDLDHIYSTRLLELAGAISHCERLAGPAGRGAAQSKLCGSRVEVELALDDGRVAAFGQTVRACLLGQVSASVMGREIIGSNPEELREVARVMRAMLKEGGEPPAGRWSDLANLAPVRDYPQRHASALLVFDAVERALIEAEGAASASRGNL